MIILPSPNSKAAGNGQSRNAFARWALLFVLVTAASVFCAVPGVLAQKSPGKTAAKPAAQTKIGKQPDDVTSRHTIQLAGKTIAFSAKAGTIKLFNAATREPIADIAYIAFTRDASDNARRPVTFAFNGGPGYASAWLNIGAMGPWRLPMDGDGLFPSAPPIVSENAESWLAFTDLVFIDPAGTGYSRILAGKGARDNLWSVKGDIDGLATTIRRWIEDHNRMMSPKYLAGESYGGFRVPRIAHALQTDQGVGVNGLILASPVLDFRRRRSRGVLSHVARLPSYAATALGQDRMINRKDLRSIEDYARGEFLVDLVKGRADTAAVKRIVDGVTRLTKLDRGLVARYAGRIPMQVFLREIYRNKSHVASAYDSLVAGLDPERFSPGNEAEDQMRLGLHAPISQAMVNIYRNRLKWTVPKGRYLFQNKQAGRSWKWGRHPPESVSHLASVVALDPSMRVLVAHGLTDLVTPYFETQLVLDQMAPIGKNNRIRFQVYSGGHMFYAKSTSRKAFTNDARKLIVGREE